MKSQTILPEEERISADKYRAYNYPYLVEKYHNALLAAEEELEGENMIIISQISELEVYESEISSLKKEVERLKKERLIIVDSIIDTINPYVYEWIGEGRENMKVELDYIRDKCISV